MPAKVQGLADNASVSPEDSRAVEDGFQSRVRAASQASSLKSDSYPPTQSPMAASLSVGTISGSQPSSSFESLKDDNNLQGLSTTPVDTDKLKLHIDAKDYSPLKLSGRIISASFCLQHRITYAPVEAEPWTLQHRAGNSALYDSFRFLSSPMSTWQHIQLSWTGEIAQNPQGPSTGGVFSINRADRTKLEQKLLTSHDISMVPVWLYDEISPDGDITTFHDQTKWRQYSEHELFRLFHYRFPDTTDGSTKVGRWETYYRMNKAFANTVLEVYSPGDVVMIHDYHLLLVPAMLRERVGDIKVSLFLHIPFPSFEYFRALAKRKEILLGMLGADMMAFQAVSYADHFKSCCQQLLPTALASTVGVEVDGRHIDVQFLPVGINHESLHAMAFADPAVDLKIEAIGRGFRGRKIIVGRDRIDPTRGVLQKLQSFAMLLARYPEWRGNVVLVQITAEPTIEDTERGGANNARAIMTAVKAINGTYGHLGYIPVRHYSTYLPREEYYALLRTADLGLITSVRDGMNTTSLEFAAAQKDNHAPLLLSEFSGTAANLRGAIDINPWDLLQTAKAINDALLMSADERREMYNKLTPSLESNPVQKWVESSLRRLCIHMDVHNAGEARPDLDFDILLGYFAASRRRLFVFDYDGTLTPIVEDPDTAVPSETLMSHLAALVADQRNAVWIVSGRDQTFLERAMGSIEGLGLSAEHGCFMKYPRSKQWINLAAQEDMTWQPKVLDMMHSLTKTVAGSVLERKNVAVTWHYRRADPKLGLHNAKSLTRKIETGLGVSYDIEVMKGKANVEVRPKAINKGQVVRRLVNDFGLGTEKEPDFVLCIGDDTTDEDMFRALRRSDVPMRNVFGIIVGSSTNRTMASWRLDAPGEVIDLLGQMVAHGDPHSPPLMPGRKRISSI